MDNGIQARVSTILAGNNAQGLDELDAMIQKATPEEAAEINAALFSYLSKVSATRTDGADGLSPPNTLSGASQKAAGNQLAAINSESLGVDMFAIMALFQKSAQEMRNTNREIRASELNAQVGSLMNAADEMKKAADFRLAAGIVSGVTQMVSGAMQFGSSVMEARSAAQAASAESNANQLSTQANRTNLQADSMARGIDPSNAAGMAKVDRLRNHALDSAEMSQVFADEAKAINADAKATGSRFDLASSTMQGASGIIGAALEHEASMHDVSAKRFEAESKLHESASQEANEMMQQMMDVIRDVREKIKDIQQSNVETTRGIARNI